MASTIVKMRTEITDEKRSILEEMFRHGMDRKSKSKLALHLQAAAKTGLDLNVVKDWVGNQMKKNSGRHYVYGKAVYSRGMTAFNCYVKEKKDELGPMKTWSKSWNSLAEAEKRRFKVSAKESRGVVMDEKRGKRQLLNEVQFQLIKLKNLGVDMACIGVDVDGSQLLLGEGRVKEYIRNKPEVFVDLFSHLSVDVGEKKTSIKMLRKQAQSHMNELYNAATGSQTGFSYHDVKTGIVEVEGVPSSILPLQHVSHYGESKLKDILSVEKIEVLRTTTAATQPTLHSSVTISNPPSKKYTVSHPASPTQTITSPSPATFTAKLLSPVTHVINHSNVMHTISHPQNDTGTSTKPPTTEHPSFTQISTQTPTTTHVCIQSHPTTQASIQSPPTTQASIRSPPTTQASIQSPPTTQASIQSPPTTQASIQSPPTTQASIQSPPTTQASIQSLPITQITTFLPNATDMSDHTIINLPHAIQTINHPPHVTNSINCSPDIHSINHPALTMKANNLTPPATKKTIDTNHLLTHTITQISDQLQDGNTVMDQTDHDIFPVEKLIQERKKGRKRQFLVQWLGYNEPTWENASNISNTLIQNFKKEKRY